MTLPYLLVSTKASNRRVKQHQWKGGGGRSIIQSDYIQFKSCMLLYGPGSIWEGMKIEQMRGKRRSGIGTRAAKEDLDRGCIMDTDDDK
jgi:hypothetical protein